MMMDLRTQMWIRSGAAALAGALALACLMVFLANPPTQAAFTRGPGTGIDPEIRSVTLTADLPAFDPTGGEGVTKTVFFSNTTGGTITVTFDLSGTQALTLTAGPAFWQGPRVYTAGQSRWTPAVSYTVAYTHGTQPGVAYTAVNTHGLTTSIAITYVRDVTPPQAAILYPAWGQAISATQLVVTGTAGDGGGAGIQRTQVTTGTGWQDAVGTTTWVYSWTLPPADNLPYTLSARAQDNLGTWSGETVTVPIVVDNVPPAVATPRPTGGPWVTSTVVFTWPASIDGAGIAGYRVRVTNTQGYSSTFSTVGPAITFTETTSEGVGYAARVRARDTWDNIGEWSDASSVVTPDLTAPTISAPGFSLILTPDSFHVSDLTLYYTNTAGGTFAVRGTSDDSLSGLDQVVFSEAFGQTPSDPTPASFAGSYDVSIGDTEEGIITTTVLDRAGNPAVQTYTYLLDGTPPTATVSGPTRWFSLSPMPITYQAGDAHSGVDRVRLYYRRVPTDTAWQDSGLEQTGTTGAFNFTPGEYGTYAFAAQAVDNVANPGSLPPTGVEVVVEQAHIYLPLVLRQWTWWYGVDVYEPNDSPDQAYGPLTSGQTYDQGYIWDGTDPDDYYHFTPSNTQPVQITLTNIPAGRDYDLYVYYYDGGYQQTASSKEEENNDEAITFTPVAGRKYYIRVYPFRGSSDQQPYHLKAVYQ